MTGPGAWSAAPCPMTGPGAWSAAPCPMTGPGARPAEPRPLVGAGGAPPVVLTIAGSDSGGGAGIQADLKTFAALGAYGAVAVTAVTAQNTLGVRAVHEIPAAIVVAQLDAVLADLPVAAVKVGMVTGRRTAALIAARLAGRPAVVVDPVLTASTGAALTPAAAIGALLPVCAVLTPNCREAGTLLGRTVTTVHDMVAAAAELAGRGPRAVVVTGSAGAVDVLWHAGTATVLRGVPVDTANDHGTGCTFSSAIAARLAAGDTVPAAVARARDYVWRALSGARHWRLGAGRGPLDHCGASIEPSGRNA